MPPHIKKCRNGLVPASSFIHQALPLDVVVHVHDAADCIRVVRSIAVTVDRMLNHTAGNGEIRYVLRLISTHQRINQTTRKGVPAANPVKDVEGKGPSNINGDDFRN